MTHRLLLLGLAPLAASAAGVACAARVRDPGSLDAQAASFRGAQRAALQQAARDSGFVRAVAALLDARGVWVTPTPAVVRGPQALRDWLARDTLNAASHANWVVLRSGISADGRDGWSYGYLDVVHAAGDTAYGKYHAYWRRDASSAWRILAISRGRRGAGPAASDSGWRATDLRPVGRAGDTVATLREVFATEAEFADSVGVDFARAFAWFAAPDAGKGTAQLPGYVFGRDAIRGLFAGAPPGSGPMWRPEAGGVASSNDLAFTYGPAWPRAEGPSPGAQSRGRYFTIWRRQSDGTWRYVVD